MATEKKSRTWVKDLLVAFAAWILSLPVKDVAGLGDGPLFDVFKETINLGYDSRRTFFVQIVGRNAGNEPKRDCLYRESPLGRIWVYRSSKE